MLILRFISAHTEIKYMTRKHYLIYICIAVFICIVPFAAMTFHATNTTSENKTLKEMPSLFTDEGFNISFMSELGDYFTDRFAFRNELVSANAALSSKLLKTSTVDDVILGENDWLYYSATLDDYRHDNGVSERMLYNMAHNVRLMQDYTEAQGRTFVFTIAPNKNSLYGENMPDRYKYIVEEESDAERLKPYLEAEGVNYLDLFELFNEQDEVLYYRKDSHWNNKGAVLVYNELLDMAGIEHETYEDNEPAIVSDYYGDLNKMLYADLAKPENDYSYRDSFPYTTADPEATVEDNIVETTCPDGTWRLLMYRDSFGNTLLPYMASEFSEGYFSKVVPYPFTDDLEATDADVVIAEKVERHLPTLAQVVPVMEAGVINRSAEESVISYGLEGLELDLNEGLVSALNELAGRNGWNPESSEVLCDFNVSADNGFIKIDGNIEEGGIDEDSPIYVQIDYPGETVIYSAFCVSSKAGDYGFTAYITPGEEDITNIDIIGVKDKKLILLDKGN